MKKPTIKQKKAITLALENGGNASKAMREAGYAEATINNPSNLTQTDAWKQMLDTYLPDGLLQKKIAEGLEANKQLAARVIFKKDAPTSQSAHELPPATSSTDDFIEVPDHAIRHKFVETALKLKDKFPAEKHKVQGDADAPLKMEIEIVEDKQNDGE